jgi:hypothetical protein
MVMNKQRITTALEIIGGISVVYGVSIWSNALAFVVAGLLLIGIGGMQA